MGMDIEKGSPDSSSGQGSSPRCCLSPVTALPEVPPTANHGPRHRVFCSNPGASMESAKVVGDPLRTPGSSGPKGSPERHPHTEGALRQPPGEPAHSRPVQGLSVAGPVAPYPLLPGPPPGRARPRTAAPQAGWVSTRPVL